MEYPPDPPTEPLPYDRITVGMEYAETTHQLIDHVTARHIAALYPAGDDSATRLLARSGAIERQQVITQLYQDYGRRGITQFENRMANHLALYVGYWGDRPPVDGWQDLQ